MEVGRLTRWSRRGDSRSFFEPKLYTGLMHLLSFVRFFHRELVDRKPLTAKLVAA